MAENSKGSARGRPFPSGQSGNPGGRPKDLVRVRELARQHTVEALDTLVRALKDKNVRARIAAAEAILDRAWGKPTQHHEIESGDELAVALDRARKRLETARGSQ